MLLAAALLLGFRRMSPPAIILCGVAIFWIIVVTFFVHCLSR